MVRILMNKAIETVKELIIGIGMWLLVILIAGCIVLRDDRTAYICGGLLGGATAAYLAWNMYRHLDIALSADVEFAESHIRKWSVIRLLIMALVVGLSMVFYMYIHPIGVVLGIWGLKIAAWIQPIVHKYRTLIYKVHRRSVKRSEPPQPELPIEEVHEISEKGR